MLRSKPRHPAMPVSSPLRASKLSKAAIQVLRPTAVVQGPTVSSRECVPRTMRPWQWHSRQPHMVSFRGSPTPLWSSNIVLHAAEP